ncbi:hypothetical protein DOY81_004258 [Sarcophaga bullata]|nr:hypothetical protein DOY81_004258 [Sarcophaga bullata]
MKITKRDLHLKWQSTKPAFENLLRESTNLQNLQNSKQNLFNVC